MLYHIYMALSWREKPLFLKNIPWLHLFTQFVISHASITSRNIGGTYTWAVPTSNFGGNVPPVPLSLRPCLERGCWQLFADVHMCICSSIIVHCHFQATWKVTTEQMLRGLLPETVWNRWWCCCCCYFCSSPFCPSASERWWGERMMTMEPRHLLQRLILR